MADEFRCPACDRSISPRSAFCMHCGVAVDEGGSARTDGDTDADAFTPRSFEASFDADPSATDGQDEADGDDTEPLLDPDGLLDDSLTVLAGSCFGLVAGVLAAFVGLVVTGSAWGALAGLIALFGGTGVFVSRHSVYETTRLGCYTNAMLLLGVPVIALTDAVT